MKTNYSAIVRTARALLDAAASSGHRRALVLAGDAGWCVAAAQAAIANLEMRRILWVSTNAPASAWAVRGTQAHGVLGQELDSVVFDAHSGFDLDAFAAVTGTIRGGGLLLLLSPVLRDWPVFPDPEYARIAVAGYCSTGVTGRFVQRLVRVLRTDTAVTIVEQDGDMPVLAAGWRGP